jgi:hypothetical protein
MIEIKLRLEKQQVYINDIRFTIINGSNTSEMLDKLQEAILTYEAIFAELREALIEEDSDTKKINNYKSAVVMVPRASIMLLG